LVELPREAEGAGHLPDLVRLVGEYEADAGAAAAGAAGTPDPVHVGVAVPRRVEVDDMGDVGDVDSAGGHVGRDQGVDFAGLETGERPLTLALALVTMHRRGVELAAAEALDEPIGAAAGADEDEGASALIAAELLDQVVELGALRLEMEEAMLDVGLAALAGGLGVAARVAGVGGGDLAGRPLQGCREEEGLALRRRLGDDPAHRRFEAHVEHAVGLIEDEDADLRERDNAARDQVLEAARGGDDDVGAAGGGALRAEADAAVDGGDSQLASLGDGAQLLDDLARQLAGGCQDQCRDGSAAGLEPVDQRDAEGERLARAGRRLDQ
jgi:hypothetical protein